MYINRENDGLFSVDATISAGLSLFAIIEVSISGHFKMEEKEKVMYNVKTLNFSLSDI